MEDFFRKFVQQPEAANKEQRRKAFDEWVDQNLENVASFYKTMVAFIDEQEAESWAKAYKKELSLGKEALSEILQANLDKGQLKAALERTPVLLHAKEEPFAALNIGEIVEMLTED